ncbi:MAG: hypothetical protein ACI8R4_003421 [Paracoccaceae bacterium]
MFRQPGGHFPRRDPRNKEEDNPPNYLPQMPQMPQRQAPARRALSDQEDAYEERAAIMEYDGGLPRPLAEFFAKKGMKAPYAPDT